MKQLLHTLLVVTIIFSSCKKEDSFVDSDAPNNTIYNQWELSIKSSSLSHGDIYNNGTFLDSANLVYYSGWINWRSNIGTGSVLISNDTIFPSFSSIYSSRIWSINQNQLITDVYCDYNGLVYNTLQHSFVKKSDTLVINFQSGEIKKFIINELTADYFQITSIPEAYLNPFAYLYPLIDENGVYKDTVLLSINSDTYFFNKITID
tara:strand:- start:102 stop:719 length:618 start_codon:yes stop_codon:yes gene_type:complete